MSDSAFQRARRPEQKRERRRAILDAAAELLEAEGADAVTLTAIARSAGLAKSNLYRYFESREDILLQLLTSDEEAWVESLEQALAPLAGSDDLHAVGAAVAETLAANPRLCALTSRVATVLEQNVSIDVARRFKDRVGALGVRIGNAMVTALPGFPIERLGELQRAMQALVVGLWPLAHPAPVIEQLLAEPDYAHLAADFAADLRSAAVALLIGFR